MLKSPSCRNIYITIVGSRLGINVYLLFQHQNYTSLIEKCVCILHVACLIRIFTYLLHYKTL